jgi:hypothetical protein
MRPYSWIALNSHTAHMLVSETASQVLLLTWLPATMVSLPYVTEAPTSRSSMSMPRCLLMDLACCKQGWCYAYRQASLCDGYVPSSVACSCSQHPCSQESLAVLRALIPTTLHRRTLSSLLMTCSI